MIYSQSSNTDNVSVDLSALLNALPHPVLVIAPDDTIDYVNAPGEIFFRSSSTMLRRCKLKELVSFGSPLLTLIEKVRKKGASVNEYGVDLGTPRSGHQQLVDIYASQIPEMPDYILVSLQRRSMAQMIERQLLHRGGARSVSGMAAVMAHEIKNPLSGIRGAAQLLEADLQPEDRELPRLICTETDRIRDLVDKIEEFGGERRFERSPVNIHSVLNHVRQLADKGFAAHIKFCEEYDPSLPPVDANRDKLIQALLNLVKNAAEAIGKDRGDGEIKLSTSYRPGVKLTSPVARTRISLPIEISISDNGPGIAEDLRPHLYDPFVTTRSNGTGLGLALVAKIISDHGGIIECDTHPGHTKFRILLPMSDQPSGS